MDSKHKCASKHLVVFDCGIFDGTVPDGNSGRRVNLYVGGLWCDVDTKHKRAYERGLVVGIHIFDGAVSDGSHN